jgi:hypothetical protein
MSQVESEHDARIVPFDVLGPHVIRPISQVLRQVDSPPELRAGENVFYVIDPGGKPVLRDATLELDGCGPPHPVRYATAPRFVASIRNAVLLARHLVLTETGEIIRELLSPRDPRKWGAMELDGAMHLDPGFFKGLIADVRRYDEPAFLMTGPTDSAFGDWIVNFGPRLALAKAVELDCRVVVRSYMKHQALEILQDLGVSRDRLMFLDRDELSIFSRLYVPSWPSRNKGAPMADIFEVYEAARLPSGPAKGPKLYLSRESAAWRPLLNEPEVRELFAGRGFEIVDPGRLSWQEVRRLFADPSCVAGPFGSAFHNLVFCGSRPRNLVLMPPHNPFQLTEIMLWHGDLDLRCAYVPGAPAGEGRSDMPWTVPIDRVERALAAVLELIEAEPG